MDTDTANHPSIAQLRAENADLHARLEEAEETLRAIRTGQVDSLIVETGEGPQIFSLNTAEAASNRLRGEILAQVADAVSMIDNDERITYLNPACERLYNVQAGEMLGCKLTELYQRRWSKNEDEALANATLREKGEAVWDLVHVTRDGRELQVQSSVCQMRDAAGNVTGLVSTYRDITERKQAEYALRLAEENLRDFVNNATVGLHWVGPDGVILWANRAELELLGYAAEEYIGRHIAEFHADPPVIEDILRRLTQRETLHEYKARLRCKDGSIREVLINSNVLWDGDKFIHTRCITRDVTEQNRAEAARDLLATIIESSEDAILSKDLNGTIATWNRGAERLFGYSAEESIGQSITMLFPPDKLDEELQIMARVRSGSRILPYETVRRRKDGGLLNVSLTVSPITDSRGQIVGASKIARDITERKRAEDALRESQQFTRRVIDNLFAFVGVLTVDGTLVEANRAPLEAAGIAASEVLGKKFWDCFWWSYSPDVQAQLRAACERAAAGEVLRYDVPVRIAGEATLWIDFQLAPLRDSEGRITHLIPSGMDITERRRNEESLRQNAELFVRLVNQAPTGMYVVDADFRMLQVNALAEPVFAKVESLIGRDFSEVMEVLWGPVVATEVVSIFRHTLASGERYVSPRFTHERYDIGEEQTYEWQTQRVSLVDGRYGVACYFEDITERQRKERAIRESEERLALGTEVAQLGLAEVDYTTGLNHLSAQAARLFGLGNTAVALPRTQARATVHPEDRDELERRIEQALDPAGDGRFAMDYRVIWPGGKERWLSVRKQVFFTGEGPARRAVRGVIAALDVTAEKTAAATVRASEERFRAAVGAVSDIVWTNNAKGEMEGEQRVWAAFTGQRQEDYRGYGWSTAVHPDDAQPTLEAWNLAVAEKRTFEFEHRLRRHDGEWRLCSIRAVPVLDLRGEIREWVGVHTDITDRKRAEERLRQFAAELSEADRRKDEFLATLAHELRNPMAPLRNGLQLMKLAGGQTEAVDKTRAMMERQLTQMVRLVDDLMDVSRITRGKLELRKKHLLLTAVLNSAVEASHPLIEQMGHELTLTLPPQPIVVDADLTRLAQVFLNLLNNAAKYTRRRGRIELSVQCQGTDVVVTVKDSGIGIAADQLPRIFDMFTQVDRSLEMAQGGLGIGLTLVKRLVALHGGTVEASSDGPGKGSEFVVRLPLAGATAQPQESDAAVESSVRSSLRILVVDDNRDGADSLSDMLTRMGNETRTAYDGEAGVNAAGEFRPDVIMFDIGMPKVNGYEACRLVREQPWGKRTVLVAVTGWGQDKDRHRTREAGFDHHMVKPVDAQDLMKLLTGVDGFGSRPNSGTGG